MRELQDRVEHLQRENDHLWAQVEKRHNLGKGDMQDSGQAKHPTVRDKGKKSIIPNDVDIPTNDELFSSNLPNPSSEKSNRARLRQGHSYRPAFSNTDNGILRHERRETGQG